MKMVHLLAPCVWALAGCAYATSNVNILQTRDVGLLCDGLAPTFSALCPSQNVISDNGLNVLEVLYFAMSNTTIPDSQTYGAGERITCMSHKPGPVIEFTASAGVGIGPVSAGVSVRVNFTLNGPDIGSVCLFPEGVPDEDQSDRVTLAQARDLLYQMIMNPKGGCKTCGRIPIHFLDRNVTDATSNGGILKADFTTKDSCIGTCVGPFSFKGNVSGSASSSASSSTSASASSTAKASGSVAKRLEIPALFGGVWFLAILPALTACAGFSALFLLFGA